MANPAQMPTQRTRPYGQAKQVAELQQAGGQAAAQIQGRQAAYEPEIVPLDAPSTAPDVPVMDGVNMGAGRTYGEAGLPGINENDPAGVADMLRGIYAATREPGILGLIQQLEGTDNDDDGLVDFRNGFGRWGRPARAGTPGRSAIPRFEFDSEAQLDEGQVQDRRLETGVGGAALGGATVGAGAQRPGGPGRVGARPRNADGSPVDPNPGRRGRRGRWEDGTPAVPPVTQPTGETADRIDEQQARYRAEYDRKQNLAGKKGAQ